MTGPTLDRSLFLRPIAHRGLHDAAAGIIENTGPAFEAAIRHGYGIECDLRPLADGTPIVFHDETLTRLIDKTTLPSHGHYAPLTTHAVPPICHPRARPEDPSHHPHHGAKDSKNQATPRFPLAPRGEGRGEGGNAGEGSSTATETLVTSLTPADLTHLHYRNSTTPILTFEDLLTLVGGAVPLLVEIKSEWSPPDPIFLAKIATLATTYRGPIALMSFDPAVLAALKTLAPTIPRGLVSGSYHSTSGDHWWHDKLTPTRAANLRDLADFDTLACSFAAYECAALPTPTTQRLRSAGIPIFTWTVRTESDRAHATLHADAMIFEGFLPPSPRT